MGRTLKRVPLDFAWPLGETWDGYLNPHPAPPGCPLCDGLGYNAATRKIADDFYDHAGFGGRWRYDYGKAPDGRPSIYAPWRVIGDCRSWVNAITQDEVQVLLDRGRLMDFTRHNPGYVPTAEEVNKWAEQGMGHDAVNRSILIEARAKRLGVWGKCGLCKGEGYLPLFPPAAALAYESWERGEPPIGAGYQLWETTSEGSPASPVFPTLDALCDWAEGNATTFASLKATATQWKAMLQEDKVYAQEGNMVFI